MRIVQVQFTPWDKIYNFSADDVVVMKGDKVVVKTDMGTEIADVISVFEVDEKNIGEYMERFRRGLPGCHENGKCPHKEEGATEKIKEKEQPDKENKNDKTEEKNDAVEIKPILRKATGIDLEKMPDEEQKKEAFKYCKTMISRLGLPMKLVGVHFAFDASRLTFSFIADGRVDFRELVKDLTRHFNRTIRLQQIGIRDEAKVMGDFGHCGRKLCCKYFLRDLVSITSEMAEVQQCVHRGSERISGVCGRLMCCLAYEQLGYEEAGKKMPAIGARVRVDGKRGVVVSQNLLKQSVDVEFAAENGDGKIIVEVDLNRHKKKKKEE